MVKKGIALKWLVFVLWISPVSIFAQERLPFYVYTDRMAKTNHYAPSGWMGDTAELKVDENSTVSPHTGKTCIKVSYQPTSNSREGWAGVYWQNPPNNWGSQIGGYNLTGAKKLSFWIRGENGGEMIKNIFVGGITGAYPDSCSASIGPLTLTKEWQNYVIDLTGKDLKYISGGFGWSTSGSINPKGCVFYLDDIVYEG